MFGAWYVYEVINDENLSTPYQGGLYASGKKVALIEISLAIFWFLLTYITYKYNVILIGRINADWVLEFLSSAVLLQ